MGVLFVPAQTRAKTFSRVVVGLLAVVIALVGGFVAATWAPDRTVTELQARWAPPPSVFVNVAGMKVHLRDEGVRDDPHPLVLLHGTSASLHTWDGWVEQLAGEHRLVRLDLPGFGLTGPAADGDYTLVGYARFMRTLLDELGIQRAVLVGNSLGGAIAWSTALASPERVEKLVLVDSGGYPLKATSIPIGFRLAMMPLLNRVFLVTLPRSVIESSIRDVYGDPSKVTPELIDRYYELTLREGNRHALLERFKQSYSDDTGAAIAKLGVPTLILWGGRDRLVPPEFAERFHHDIAGSKVVVFDDLGHVPQEEDPVRTAAAVREFL